MTLQTVERALGFLEVIAASARPLTIREVAREMGLKITSSYHFLNTLLALGYVERNADQTLRIGFRAAALYDGYRRGFTSQERINEFLAALARTTCETAFLSTLVNDAVVLTAFVDGPQALRATGHYVGLSGLEHVRSSGRAVLAFLDDERREQVLSRSLSAIAPAQHAGIREALAEDLQNIRSRGWALDDQNYNAGIVGIAAPFFSDQDEVVGAVGITAPAQRAHGAIDTLTAKVIEAARSASDLLGRHH